MQVVGGTVEAVECGQSHRASGVGVSADVNLDGRTHGLNTWLDDLGTVGDLPRNEGGDGYSTSYAAAAFRETCKTTWTFSCDVVEPSR